MKLQIKELRTSKKITQTELARMLDWARTRVARYENGTRKLSAQNALKIAEALGCTVEDLFTHVDGEKEESEEVK